MKNIIEFIVGLIKKAPVWLRVTFITLLCIILGLLGFLYVSCGSLSLKDLDWRYKDVPQVVAPENLDSVNN